MLPRRLVIFVDEPMEERVFGWMIFVSSLLLRKKSAAEV